jgi:hypothetical protein
LRRALLRRTDQAVLQHPGVQERAGERQHTCIRYTLSQTAHQEVMIHSVEKLFDVEVHDPPITARKMSLRGGDRLMCRPPRPKPVAVVGECRVEDGLQHLQHRLLDKSVERGGHAEFAHATIWLGYLDASDRRRCIQTSQQLVPMLWPVRPQVVRELLDGHPVDARASLVCLDTTQRFLQVFSLTHCLH